MGFFLQLRILLWKNFTLKKRSPGVVMFELFIPLVLFVILLAIRKKQPADPKSASHFRARPLPSAGVMSIMQAFCAGGVRNEYGYQDFPHSTAYSFLEEFNTVATNNNFFDPGFSPQDMDHIPDLYRSIIDDPASLHNTLERVKYLNMDKVVTNSTALKQVLMKNLSLTDDQIYVVSHSQVNIKEVYRILFGTSHLQSNDEERQNSAEQFHRFRRSLTESLGNAAAGFNSPMLGPAAAAAALGSPLGSALGDSPLPDMAGFHTFANGLIYKILEDDPELLLDPEVMDVLEKLMGFKGSTGDIDPKELADVIKKFLFAKGTMKDVICDSESVTQVLIPPQPNMTETLMEMQWSLCNMTNAQWSILSTALKTYINADEIVVELGLEDTNITVAREKVLEFSKNLREFILFEQNLMELSKFASSLPQDVCESEKDEENSTVPTNSTEEFTQDPLHIYVPTEASKKDLNATTAATSQQNESSDSRMEPGKDRAKTKEKEEKEKPPNQYAGLLRIWMAMQTTVCGLPSISKDKMNKFSESNSLDDLGLTNKQKYDIGILIHVLYSNPKVLYAPNNTEADSIIRKANETFALVDHISAYAHKWLNVSAEIREYLLKNTTEDNLDSIREMQNELNSLSGLEGLVENNPSITQFAQNTTVPHTNFFLSQLDTVDSAACSWLSLVKGISMNVFRGFHTEAELVRYAMHEAYHDNVTVFASVIFNNLNEDGSLPPHIVYKIRQNATFTGNTQKVRPAYWFPGPMAWSFNYYQFGFVWIQDIIERAVIDIFAGRDVVEPGSYVHEFPYPCYMNDQFLFMIEHVMPLCLTISWVYTVAMLVQSIVYEKEQRLKEVMKMMGLSNSVHWLAWFITTFTQMSISMGTLTAMLKYGHVLTYSNSLLIFLVLEIFAIATISFSFLVSVLYSKAKLAAACAGIVYFLSYVPYMYVAIREEAAGDKIPAWAKTIASLFSTTAFGLGSKYFAFYEIEGVGVQWSNINISPVESDQYNLFMVLVMMIIDAFIYGILTWYIENVHPGSYGLPKPWYFPLTKSYWVGHGKTEAEQCSWRRCLGEHANISVIEDDQACAMAANVANEHHFEQEPSHLALGVCVDNLTKRYKTGKLAVNNLSFNLYEGQIMSFLGHNGAGKTTTMSILSGMFPPTSGYATVYGHDIRTDMEEIRKSLGMCPQHNVLFDKLTVEEHLWFYAKLKGMSAADMKVEMENMIQDLGLPEKRRNTVDCLSGGMKRKLSVAIAFVAGSRTIILDEPTAGVDPYARRAIWDLLIKYKHGRTILLSTHHMDEADILGDRIAIISNGQIKCAGTSLFLKSTFGEGYYLTLVKKPSELDAQSTDTFQEDLSSSQSSFHTRCVESKVTEFILKYVSTAYLKYESNQQLHYILPFEEAKKGAFEKLFEALDRSLAQIEISSYGVADTTLEEVFLKVTESSLPSILEDIDDKNEPKLLQNLTTDQSNSRPVDANEDDASQSSVMLGDRDDLVDLPGQNRTSTQGNLGGRHSRQGSDVPLINPSGGHSRQSSDVSLRAYNMANALGRSGHSRQNSDTSLIAGRINGLNVELSALAARTNDHTPFNPESNPQGHARQNSDTSRITLGHSRQGSDVPLISAHASGGHSRQSSDVSILGGHFPAGGHSRQSSDVPLLDITQAGHTTQDNMNDEDGEFPLEGRGSYVVQGHMLLLQQFLSIIKKRYVYIRRNWKGLFSQILLPALFVCVAMTVALTAPQLQDQPPIILSPAQYYNYTQPRGNYIPYANLKADQRPDKPSWSLDAGPGELVQTFRLPSGVASTCVLKTPFNSSFDEAILQQLNFTYRNFKLLEKYFDPSCESVFRVGLPLENFVPPAPTAPPSVAPLIDPNQTTVNLVTPVTQRPVTQRYFPECHCASDKTSYICSKSGFQYPPYFQVVTSDVLQDITGDDEDHYYLHTTDMYRLHRYGAFSFGNTREFVPPEFGRHAPSMYRKLAVRNIAKVWFNHKGYHSMPIYLNALNNAILRANLPRTRGNPAAYGITLINHPMNNTERLKTVDYIMQGSDVLIAIFIIVAMSFVPASFVLFLVYEKSIKAKHLQFVSGINRVIYWLANYIWDMCNYLIPGLCCVLILKVFDIPSYTSGTNFPAVVALFLMYGWSITPMMYPASFVFNEPSTAYIFLIVINLFVGITCIITSFLLQIFQINDKDLGQIHEVLKNIFLVFPNYCLGRGLMDIAFNQYQNDYYFKTGQYNRMRSPFEWKVTSRNLVGMAVMGFSFFIITLICEYRFFIKPRRIKLNPLATPANEDADVGMERRRVTRGSGRRDLIRLENLTKIYKTRKLGRHLAVDRLCLGVPQGECFGLLGVNGAGKTTTFKMLTGDLPPTGGDAFLNGHSILRELSKVQQNLGYCPQFDALYDELTAREHLYLYAALRGVPYKDQAQVVEWALKKLALTQYADKMSGTYSGGNKRKLSTAIALIGQAPVIFLDEPTTGMDPHSRRFLWDLILNLIKSGRSVILTSHSMEECEALCTRLAIMVNGQFKCMGSPQHLKNRFGEGYTVTIRVKGPNYEREVRAIQRYMLRHFPQATLKEQHHNMVQYELTSGNLSLSFLFGKMEEAQRDMQVEDYSVCQNNLDNVFINFVKQQVELVIEDGSLSLSRSSSGGGPTELQPINSEDNLESDNEDDITTSLNNTRLSFIENSNC